MTRGAHAAVVVSLSVLAACGRGNPPTPSPGGGNGETITGRERIGWDQQASSAAQLATFRYAVYVDGSRSEVADVSCGSSAGASGFVCSGRLPPMANGSHVLEIAAFVVEPAGVFESPRSSRLLVTVTGIGTDAVAALADGEIVTTGDGVPLRAEVLFDGLVEPTAIAVASDGRAFIGTTRGVVIVAGGKAIGSVELSGGPVMSLVLSPGFAGDAHVYVTQAVLSESGDIRFLTARYRNLGSGFAERMVLLENGPAAAAPAAAIRIGPDAKLYAAFDDGGSATASERMSEWSGKVLRMELDGRTPADQAAASPVLIGGLTSPRGFDWTPDGSAIWLADASRDGIERLRIITTTSERPRRAGQRTTFTMPSGVGAAAVTFYRGDRIREFSENLLIAGRDGGYILRVLFARDDRSRPESTERLLEGRVRTVRTLTVGPDGAIYFCTDEKLIRLVRAG